MAAMQPGEWLRLPEVCEEDTLRRIHQLVERSGKGLGGVVLGSAGQLGLSWNAAVAAGIMMYELTKGER